jgi:tRNA A-37 threonylcarbamoyl transferase component Bud32/GTP:adenosylcobinamide-phosphate guanylyltransferase
MEYQTANKPKCLISIYGKPLLYHLSDVFKGCKFFIITGYKADVLKAYMKTFPPEFEYELIKENEKGTCDGLQTAIDAIPNKSKFALVWSDLYFSSKLNLPKTNANFIGISNKLMCRWRISNGRLVNEVGRKNGVIGLFIFRKPKELPLIPNSGEFVRFIAESDIKLKKFLVRGVSEIGTLNAFNEIKRNESHSRFFNSIKFHKNSVVKTIKNKDYAYLLENEINWYKFVKKAGYTNIPTIFRFKPLSMELLKGASPHKYKNLNQSEKESVLNKIFGALESLHDLSYAPYDITPTKEVYVKKTWERIRRVAPLIPSAETPEYFVNGKVVRNLLNPKNRRLLTTAFNRLRHDGKFTIIHGDPTFSNIILSRDLNMVSLIDPRGYFGKLKLYGDPLYDYAKLYYSVVGNYDAFNERLFELHVNGINVTLTIQSNNWESLEKVFYLKFKDRLKEIKILHAFIWLSLAGYVIDDVDSMLGAYFRGLELLEEALKNG